MQNKSLFYIFLGTVLLFSLHYVLEHNRTLQQPHITRAPFSAHEADPILAKQLDTAYMQAHHATELIPDMHTSALTTYADELKLLHKKLTKTSPAIALLGPLGTASVALKERDIARRTLTIVHDIGRILHAHIGTPYQPAKKLKNALKQNQLLLSASLSS